VSGGRNLSRNCWKKSELGGESFSGGEGRKGLTNEFGGGEQHRRRANQKALRKQSLRGSWISFKFKRCQCEWGVGRMDVKGGGVGGWGVVGGVILKVGGVVPRGLLI